MIFSRQYLSADRQSTIYPMALLKLLTLILPVISFGNWLSIKWVIANPSIIIIIVNQIMGTNLLCQHLFHEKTKCFGLRIIRIIRISHWTKHSVWIWLIVYKNAHWQSPSPSSLLTLRLINILLTDWLLMNDTETRMVRDLGLSICPVMLFRSGYCLAQSKTWRVFKPLAFCRTVQHENYIQLHTSLNLD